MLQVIVSPKCLSCKRKSRWRCCCSLAGAVQIERVERSVAISLTPARPFLVRDEYQRVNHRRNINVQLVHSLGLGSRVNVRASHRQRPIDETSQMSIERL